MLVYIGGQYPCPYFFPVANPEDLEWIDLRKSKRKERLKIKWSVGAYQI
jgi:hypothetical protein